MEDKIKAIKEAAAPRNTPELKSFLGMQVVLTCDASPYGVGALLAHGMGDGSERPLGYVSRTLSKAEKGSQNEKEGLSIAFGVKKSTSHSHGSHFTIVSNHKLFFGLFEEDTTFILSAFEAFPLERRTAKLQKWKAGGVTHGKSASDRPPFLLDSQILVPWIPSIHLSKKKVRYSVIDYGTCEQRPIEALQCALSPISARLHFLFCIFKARQKNYLFKTRVVLENLQPEMWLEEHEDTLDEFIHEETQRVLTVHMDQYLGLQVLLGTPSQFTDYLMYFIRKEKAEINSENFVHVVQFGTIRGGHLESLLRHMLGIYAPQFMENRKWPESLKNNFSGHLHKFLASLTDARYKLDGHTVLYIPVESLNLTPERAAMDKELVQRLETAVVHWTRQIKDVLSAQEAVETGEIAGPLDEVEFWRNRCDDLSGIGFQLDKAGVKHIQSILELSKSSYIAPFLKLAKLIQDGRSQAQSNLSFLTILTSPCAELTKMKVKDIPAKLPHILSLIRIIWVNSRFYNTRDRITALFRKLSNEIIRLCSGEISLDRIFDGHIKLSKITLHDCIECCQAWKSHFARAASIHTRFSNIPWILDNTSVFAQVDAFIQRCRDLLE
ncbi:dynein axonemal heavy chain 2-like, partial [Mustelus asterias]